MLDGLQTEINRYPELIGASKRITCQKINSEPGLVETWVVSSDICRVPKGDTLAMLSNASQVKLYDWLKAESNEAKGFSLLFYAHDHFKTSDPVFRGTISLLHDPLALITLAEKDAILRLGERLQTRAEELFGRDIVEEDFE